MNQEEKIKLANLEQQIHVIKLTDSAKYNKIVKAFENNLEKSKNITGGEWKTVNGSHVYIKNGKVEAGVKSIFSKEDNKKLDDIDKRNKKDSAKEKRYVNSLEKDLVKTDKKIKDLEDQYKEMVNSGSEFSERSISIAKKAVDNQKENKERQEKIIDNYKKLYNL